MPYPIVTDNPYLTINPHVDECIVSVVLLSARRRGPWRTIHNEQLADSQLIPNFHRREVPSQVLSLFLFCFVFICIPNTSPSILGLNCEYLHRSVGLFYMCTPQKKNQSPLFPYSHHFKSLSLLQDMHLCLLQSSTAAGTKRKVGHNFVIVFLVFLMQCGNYNYQGRFIFILGYILYPIGSNLIFIVDYTSIDVRK